MSKYNFSLSPGSRKAVQSNVSLFGRKLGLCYSSLWVIPSFLRMIVCQIHDIVYGSRSSSVASCVRPNKPLAVLLLSTLPGRAGVHIGCVNAISSRQPVADGFCGTSEPGVYLLLDVQLPRSNLSFCVSSGGLSRARSQFDCPANASLFCCYMERRQFLP